MMDFSEKWGKDVDEAVTLALRDLKVTIDEVEVKVLEEPSKGFLGIGSKLAKVRVELKSKGEKRRKRKEGRDPGLRVQRKAGRRTQKRKEDTQEGEAGRCRRSAAASGDKTNIG